MKINNWTVLKNDLPGFLRKTYLVRCKCGFEASLELRSIKRSQACTNCRNEKKREARERLILELIGKRFHRLIVLSRGGFRDRHLLVKVQCDCGLEFEIDPRFLSLSKGNSCRGCSRKTHGKSRSRIYSVWHGMKRRCSNPNLKNYGGRGIKYSERWEKFENFFSDMGECPDDYQLDRTDPDGDYTPENCKWVSRKENASNRRNSKKYQGQYFYVKKDHLCSSCLSNPKIIPPSKLDIIML